MTENETIVAEVSKTWKLDEEPAPPPLISQQFENIIAVNKARGYVLSSWRMTSVPIGVSAGALSKTISITETIVAVFEREQMAV